MKQLLHSIKDYCVNQYETIAVADNVTNGCLQMMLGSVAHAEQYFLGGVTLADDRQLFAQSGVAPGSCRNNNACLALTIDMAKKVALRCNSEIGIAVRGSSSVPEPLSKPVYIAIIRFQKVIYAGKLLPVTQSPDAAPVVFARRVICILAEQLMPAQEEFTYTTSEILEPLS